MATAALTLVAGCGGSPDAGEVLGQTAERLATVRSGDLKMSVTATPHDRPHRGVGFELSGPFSLEGAGPLPVTRMRYTRIVGDQRSSAVLTSTGREAFVTTAGRTTQLDPAGSNALRAGGGRAPSRSLSEAGLDVDEWIEDGEVAAGPRVAGTETQRVTGRLRTGRVVHDVLVALRSAGVEVGDPGDRLIAQIDDLVRSSRAELLTGRQDRILRRLQLTVQMRAPRELAAALPGGGAVRLAVRLDLRRPNRPVRVEAP